jgi:hypothetical protein
MYRAGEHCAIVWVGKFNCRGERTFVKYIERAWLNESLRWVWQDLVHHG